MLTVPYQSQRDNISGQGWRECFSSSVAMLLMQRGAVRNDDEYNSIRRKFGDTTQSRSHLLAVASLGLYGEYIKTADKRTVEQEIRAGRAIAVGWLHHGHVSRPSGGGHWSVIIGTNATHLWMHDPFGEPLLVTGGHITGSSGANIRCSWRNFGPRWMVEGGASGWAFMVRG